MFHGDRRREEKVLIGQRKILGMALGFGRRSHQDIEGILSNSGITFLNPPKEAGLQRIEKSN